MTATKTALILGVTGQDGAHMAQLLLRLGWVVYGGFRRGVTGKTWRLDELGITDKVRLVNIDIGELYQLIEAFRAIRPAHIYHFAGESFVADSFDHPKVTIDVNVIGTLNVLEAMRAAAPEARLFFTSSSEVFGRNKTDGPLDEASECRPSNPYGISKLTAQHLVRLFRDTYGLFTSIGIMFNHEGPLRARSFVTRKITYNLTRLRMSRGAPMELGQFGAARDWGSAEDYVEGMHAVMGLERPGDYVFATGRVTSIREFLGVAAVAAGFAPVFENSGADEICYDRASGLRLAQVSPRYFRPFDTPPLTGNAARLREHTGWGGSRSIERIAEGMIEADLHRWEKGIHNV
jgi:GDPmannose 4,6-dehydratase